MGFVGKKRKREEKKKNVIGVPITDETLKAMSRYRHKKKYHKKIEREKQ